MTNLSPKGALAARWSASWAASAGRRLTADRKLRILREDHQGLILQKLQERIPNPELFSFVSRFVTLAPNLVLAVVSAIGGSVYDNGVLRKLRGASPELARAFGEIVNECGINSLASAIAQRAWLAGPVGIGPHLDRRGRLALDIVTPDVLDLERTGKYVDAALWLHKSNTWIELDSEEWRYYDARGKLTRNIPHGAKECPLVPFLAGENLSDYWQTSAHSGLVGKCLEVSILNAHGTYVQQVSANKLTHIDADNVEDMAALQNIGEFALPVVGEADIKVIDRSVDPAPNWGMISRAIADAVSVYGISPTEVTGFNTSTSEWGSLAIKIRSERIGAQRSKQIEFIADSEQRLWPVVVGLLRKSEHRHADLLPPPDEVAEMLRLSFAETADPEEIKARIAAMEAGLSHGLTSALETQMRLRREMSEVEAQELMDERLEAYARRNAFLARNNLPSDASLMGKPLDAQQGREGGLISGEVRRGAADPAAIEDGA